MNEGSFDLIIIGCGPAGLSSLLWASDLGLRAVALEAGNEPGGQLLRTFNRIENYLGVETPDGRTMRDVFLKQLSGRNPDIRPGLKAKQIKTGPQDVFVSDGTSLAYRTLLIATGVRRRELGVPGETELQGRGILQSGKHEAVSANGKNAVVIGGGDAAFENALILSEFADRVSLIHRRVGFSARGEFVEAVNGRSNIDILQNKIIRSINGKTGVESVTVKDVNSGVESNVEAETVVVRIGVVPNSELVKDICEMDKSGYLIVDINGMTTSRNIYAAGDVANPGSPTISSAVGMASTALKTIRRVL